MKSFLLLFVALIVTKSLSAACSLPNYAFDEKGYRLVHKLIAAGLIENIVLGQKPWSRAEFVRVIQEATQELDRRAKASEAVSEPVSEILTELREEFRDEIRACDPSGEASLFKLLESARLETLSHNSPSRRVIDNSITFGGLDTTLNPLLDNRAGREYGQNNLSLETLHWGKLGENFSLLAHSRLLYRDVFSSDDSVRSFVQKAYGKYSPGNFEIEVGRDELLFGHGSHGGTLFSANVRPFDQVRLGTISPFRLPSFLSIAGPTRALIYLAHLGTDREFPNALLYGLLFNFRPHPRLELGFGHSIIFGGDGAPPWSWVDIPLEFFFLRRGGAFGSDAGAGGSPFDHRSVFSLHYRMPLPKNPELYAEMFWDDTGFSSIVNHLKNRTGWQLGLYFPILSGDLRDELRVEYVSLPSGAYAHSAYSSGYVLNHRLIGGGSGPASLDLSVRYRRSLLPAHAVELTLGGQIFDGNLYDFHPDSYERSLLAPGITEERYRAGLGYEWDFQEQWRWGAQAFLEKVTHFGFQPGGQTNYLFSTFLKFRQ